MEQKGICPVSETDSKTSFHLLLIILVLLLLLLLLLNSFQSLELFLVKLPIQKVLGSLLLEASGHQFLKGIGRVFLSILFFGPLELSNDVLDPRVVSLLYDLLGFEDSELVFVLLDLLSPDQVVL